jgi:hypothetical protein
VLTLREELGRVSLAIGTDARLAKLMGTTERSIQRWRAGAPIADGARAFLRVLAAVESLVDLVALLDGHATLLPWALEAEVQARLAQAQEREPKYRVRSSRMAEILADRVPYQPLEPAAVVTSPATMEEAPPATMEEAPPAPQRAIPEPIDESPEPPGIVHYGVAQPIREGPDGYVYDPDEDALLEEIAADAKLRVGQPAPAPVPGRPAYPFPLAVRRSSGPAPGWPTLPTKWER